MSLVKKRGRLSEFFKDSRGNFDIFTVISVLAGLALVVAGLVEAWYKHTVQPELIWAWILTLNTHLVGEKVVSGVIERGFWKPGTATPDTQIVADVKTDSVNVVGSAENESTSTPDFLGKGE